MSSEFISKTKVNGGIIATANSNVNVWYERPSQDEFILNGSLNNLQTIFDWVTIRSTNKSGAKSGVLKYCDASRQTFNVRFQTPFVDDNYRVFFSCNENIQLYTESQNPNGFVIKGSFKESSEISWLAIHESLCNEKADEGIFFCGEREMVGESVAISGKEYLDIEDDNDSNITSWYNDELIIMPNSTLDDIGSQTGMDLDDYSIILSSNTNINTYWIEKATDRCRIGVSYPSDCTIHYLLIKNGINWWDSI